MAWLHVSFICPAWKATSLIHRLFPWVEPHGNQGYFLRKTPNGIIVLLTVEEHHGAILFRRYIF